MHSLVGAFFPPEKYFGRHRSSIFMAVFVGISARFLAPRPLGKAHRKSEHKQNFRFAIVSGWSRFARRFPACFRAVADRPPSVQLSFRHRPVLLALNAYRKKALDCPSPGRTRGPSFFLGAWTGNYLTLVTFIPALRGKKKNFYFVFRSVSAATPIALQRLHNIEVPRWTHIFPALALPACA